MNLRVLLCLLLFIATAASQTPPLALALSDSRWTTTDPSALELVSGLACHSRKTCAILRSAHPTDLSQTLDAVPYRGKTVTLHANVRTSGTPGSRARIILRVRRDDGASTYEYDLGNLPISLWHWMPYEVHAPIAGDARDIQVVFRHDGAGAAWLDDVTIDFSSSAFRAEDLVVRDVVAKFSAARNRQDGPAAAALYDNDAVWFPPDGNFSRRGRELIAFNWSRMNRPLEAARAIQSVEFPSANVAIVHAAAEFVALPPVPYLSHEIFVLIKTENQWLIKVQQLSR